MWLLRRLLLCIPTLLGITIVTFGLSRLAPGGPLSALADDAEGGRPMAAKELEQLRHRLGFDRPLAEQYLDWLGCAVTLDFGRSLTDDPRPVREKIGAAAKVSLALQGSAALLIYALGIPLGIWSAVRAGKGRERVVSSLNFLLLSMPTLLVGTVLIVLFASPRFPLFPLSGLTTPGMQSAGQLARAADVLRHAALPVACLVLCGLAGVTRYMRAGMLESLRQPWICAARARGLPERLVVGRHAFKSGILPLVSLLSGLFPWLVAGSVTVEALFSLPGLGSLLTESIARRDFPVVMALSVIVGVATLFGFILSDLAHALLRRPTELA